MAEISRTVFVTVCMEYQYPVCAFVYIYIPYIPYAYLLSDVIFFLLSPFPTLPYYSTVGFGEAQRSPPECPGTGPAAPPTS
jgi:hypothetical protein